MAAFPLPAGHPFASVRPGYAGFESTPDGSVINATASYVGASGDYPANAITLQLFGTQGGTWNVGTPAGLTVQTLPALNQAYTAAVYTGGLRGQTYTFTSISLTPAQGAMLGWTGTVPSVTLTIPSNITTIASGYYLGGNAIYLTPDLDSTLTPLVQGITNYFFVCTTSAAYTSVDSVETAVIPFPAGTTFTAGTTTSLNFTVQCRSNGILGQPSSPFTVGIVQPAVPTLTGAIVGNNINLTFANTTPGCTFDLSYGGNVIASGITSPYSYTTTTPGVYTFQVRASLCGLSTFSVPSTITKFPAQPSGVSTTVIGLSITLAWTGLGTGYTYNVSGTGVTTQVVSMPSVQFTNLVVGSPTFYIQSVYTGLLSTTCNVQVSIPTTPPYNFRGSTSSSTITLSWANDTPGAAFTLSSSSPSTLASQFDLTTSNFTYTNVPGGFYSFTVFSTSAGIPSSSVSIAGLEVLSAPTNFGVTTLSSTANLTWQNATTGASFNISYMVGTTLSSKAVAALSTTTSISGLPAGNYTFAIQSLITGASSSFVTAAATIVAAPTNFKATSTGTTISLSWIESTPGCTFTITQPILGTRTTADSNVQYTGATAGSSYLFTLTPCNTTAFVGPSVTTTGTVLTTPAPSAVLSGTNVTVSWTAVTGTGITYTVSSSPRVTAAPAQPGSTTSVIFVSPPPAAYTFSVIAAETTGNVSATGTTSSLTVPVPQPTSVGLAMTTSSQLTVTWTELFPGCTFTYQNGPVGITPTVTSIGTSYTAVFNGIPLLTGYSPFTITATFNGIDSLPSTAIENFLTFPSFDVTLSATCSQSGTSNNAIATYTINNPLVWHNVYGPPSGAVPNPVTVRFSGTTNPPAISPAFEGFIAALYYFDWWGKATGVTNMVPTTFGQFVVPPTSLTVTASGTNLLVKWTDSTTAGCRYTVVGTPGTFTSNVAAGSGSTGITFTGATVETAYRFVVTASSTGSYTASRVYYSVPTTTTENATIPYIVRSVSVSSTAVTPIAYPATFTATATGTTIAINWGAVTGATGYTVYDSGTSLFPTTTATTCNYTATVGQTYTLTVQAIGSSASNTNPNSITVTPVAVPAFSSFAQASGSLIVGATGTGLSINTPTGLTLASSTANSFTFSGVGGNTAYSFTLTSTGTNATSSATSSFTTMGTPVITSANAQGTATITVNWTYTGPTVTGFTVYSNSVSAASVGASTLSAVFPQSAETNNTDFVYVVASIGNTTSRPSASIGVADLLTLPAITSSTVNGLGFTVQWTYPTSATALSNFQVWNLTQTTSFGSAVAYSATQSTYSSVFNVPSIAAYSFVVVGRNSVGSTVVSLSSTPVTPVAAPTITSVVQTGSTITISATGSSLSTPTVSPTLTTASTSSPWAFTGATGNTLYTFTVQANNGTNASNTTTCNFTTLVTPDIPTLSANGTTVTVGLPSSSPLYSIFMNPKPDVIWRQTTAESAYWYSIASSSNGQKLAAVVYSGPASLRGIYTNVTYGVGSWTKTSASSFLQWTSIASSSDGTKLVAVADAGGIWTNANSGIGDWTRRPVGSPPVNPQWLYITSDSNGKNMAAVSRNGGLWTNTTDGAGTWTQPIDGLPPSGTTWWTSIASSSDGQKLAATVRGGGIWTNANYGAGTWTKQAGASSTLNWYNIASSSDGTKLVAVAGDATGGLWTNANSGAGSWTERIVGLPRPADWQGIASSSNGEILMAGVYQGGIYRSTDYGATWTRLTNGIPNARWYSIATDSSGTKTAAVAEAGGGIYTYQTDALRSQGTLSTTFTASVGVTYSVSLAATIGADTSIASPSPLTSPLSAATGCILWLDGADPNNTGSPVANGTTITTWKDKSGNGNDATSQNGTIPIVNNALTFDGTKYLYVPNISGKLVNTPFVVFVVETLTGPNGYGLFFGDDNTSVPGRGVRLHLGYRNWGNVTMGFWGDMDIEDYSMIAQTGETRIWAFYLATGGGATARFIRRNGNNDQVSLGSSTYTYLSHFITPCIGRIAQAYNYIGQIAEILVFPTDIGIPAIQRIEQYLANKWKVSSKSGIITPIATPTASATANGGTITVTCGTSTSGTVLNIPTTPTGLTLSAYTRTTFAYTGGAGGTNYSFLAYAYNGPATSLPVSTSVTPLYTPGKPTVTAAGTTVNITWTYGPNETTSVAGLQFNVSDANQKWAGTSVLAARTTSFVGQVGSNYSIYVNTSGAAGLSPNSASTAITPIGPPSFTQNYQSTTQTKIVGTAAATGATSYSGTTDSSGLLSPQTPAGGILTWSGATAGRIYNGITIGAAAGAATSSIVNRTLQSAFNPLSIPDCVLWLDAADTTTYVGSTTSLTGWKDKSDQGNNPTLLTSTLSGPSVVTNPNNNLPGLTFPITSVNSTNPGYTYGNPFTVANLLAGTTNYSMIGVVQYAPMNGANGMWAAGQWKSYYSGFLAFAYGGIAVSLSGGGEYRPLNIPVTGTPLSPHIYSASISSSTTSVNATTIAGIDGADAVYTSTVGPNTAATVSPFGIGADIEYGTAYYPLTGYLHELIVFNRALTSSQLQAIEGYLAWKWGLQGSLSPTNPYSPLASPAATAPPISLIPVNYLVVGGGGGGGSRFGGGGGGGGFQEGTSFGFNVAKGIAYTVTVGTGGAGGIGNGTAGTGGQNTGGAQPGVNGTSSVFFTITATGGGGGAAGDGGNGLNGASGGGGAGRAINANPYYFFTSGGTGTPGQGNNGKGSSSGTKIGGGGGGAGVAATSTTGGAGKISSITGTSVTYAGGGGGGGTADGDQNGSPGGAGGGGAGGGYSGTGIPATPGTQNTGGGGGGGAFNTTGSYPDANQPGAVGGSGVVILSYAATFGNLASITGTLAPTTPSTVGANLVYRFTSGTGTITW